MTDYLAIQEAEQAVDQGYQLLTEELGAEWPQYVNVGTLDMADPTLCVVGQIAQHLDVRGTPHGRYNAMIVRLGLDPETEITHGFEVGIHTDWKLEDLRHAWAQRISGITWT